ncbi:dhh family phosphoesterase : Exopolyphosphatase-like enzyme OS=Singulisphaera acidiphila (strain ATCC BAA-1392 / DSM 18658 / VKM B-2454 / MOB10) GN=Sinac_3763 PE=4 SV=1: DHH: DHHA1 [Gemmataceae bacterium]|nr:dhh family phosphoesterase : Exopolyphosphatase-like enzyme OS=Singulisphaera acidiphila (strain ATCC BAA-1392 / DSM 18658 / VKM B-2454 / MOB10) GN=Sinac_3763 PE=4 SV=1: DHH: DHHA1 [Gemmataceae bacterium]VTU01751.1 dhh family phosphoesterase : Exopolyphosphatase-like enzyme OS=Singulisphaera acidiphila (strain ATCC BAA-1392 / DSM 18658 / VKM B-2454 / MOB10) GN=Sinac_3763 PE=4 SV=1: DHH: DHHA1 [Gemmataceae bacterium]
MARRSADSDTVPRSATGLRRSDRFLSGLQGTERVVFVSHVNPDPDALASMLGLAHLVEHRLTKPTLLTRDGLIGRAENKAMVEGLDLDLVPIEEVDWRPDDAIVMVDSQPNTGRHTFPEVLPIYAVLDHHDTPGDLDRVSFTDIRATAGATSTVVTKYLIEQDVPVTEKVATALLYGIETEVTGYPREAGPADDDALLFLYPLADKDLIAQIRNARLPHSHFEVLLQALQSSFIYDRLIISWVDDLPAPEQAAEVVDFMIRFEKVDWAVCGGVCGDKLILSLRAAIEHASGGELLRQVVGKLGRAGGHERRAGGCIPLSSTSKTAVDELQAELRRRFLKAFKIEDVRGQRLVPLREMLENLQS